MSNEIEKIKIILKILSEKVNKKHPILKEYSEEENQTYYSKRNNLPQESNVLGLKEIIQKLNNNNFNLKFIYSLPYPDSSDKNNSDKHKAIPNKWWSTISIEGVDEFYGRLKLVNRGDGQWKYFNYKSNGNGSVVNNLLTTIRNVLPFENK